VPVYPLNRKGVKNGAVAVLASDYFLMIDRLILPMALKTMKEQVDPGTMPAGFLKENIINLNEQQIEKLKLKVPQLWRFYRYETCITRLFRLWIAQ
jgi:hypothetical protein